MPCCVATQQDYKPEGLVTMAMLFYELLDNLGSIKTNCQKARVLDCVVQLARVAPRRLLRPPGAGEARQTALATHTHVYVYMHGKK